MKARLEGAGLVQSFQKGTLFLTHTQARTHSSSQARIDPHGVYMYGYIEDLSGQT